MFTYSGDPHTTEKDRVRFELADTNREAAKFQDAEVDAAIAEAGSWQGGAAILARAYATRLSSLADVKVGALSIDYSRMASAWEARADELDAESGEGASAPALGGVSGTRDVPMFWKGMHDNAKAGQGFSGSANGLYPPPGSRYYQ